MSGYSSTPLHRKLGVKAGAQLTLVGCPPGWMIPDLPSAVRCSREPMGTTETTARDLIIAFYSSQQEMSQSIATLARRIFPDGAIWSAWPRRAGGHESDITERDIRAMALPLGLVDVKVAALDEDWSGLRLVWRKENRHTP